jgi:hypothetical protein
MEKLKKEDMGASLNGKQYLMPITHENLCQTPWLMKSLAKAMTS